jgi:hypothetical protein
MLTAMKGNEVSEEEIRRAVSAGIVEGAHQLADDEKFAGKFWEVGFKHLRDHTTNHASMWLGRRILTAFVAAVVTAGLIWMVKSGAIK